MKRLFSTFGCLHEEDVEDTEQESGSTDDPVIDPQSSKDNAEPYDAVPNG